jgi:hypothetical protein
MSTGAFLLFMGIGTFVPPFFGLQFKILSWMRGIEYLVGAVMALVGAVMMLKK